MARDGPGHVTLCSAVKEVDVLQQLDFLYGKMV